MASVIRLLKMCKPTFRRCPCLLASAQYNVMLDSVMFFNLYGSPQIFQSNSCSEMCGVLKHRTAGYSWVIATSMMSGIVAVES